MYYSANIKTKGKKKMSKIHSFKAEERTATGTGSTRALRRKGLVPAIIYGGHREQVLVAISSKELTLEYRRQGFLSHMFDIVVGKNKYRALPKSIQLHPVTDEIEHMDFIHINENDKIKIHVTLHFINEQKCPGIKQGGLLNVARHDIEVYCLPNNIPEKIEIDIEHLNIGQTIHVRDIVLPKDVETKMDLDSTIAAIVTGKVTTAEEEAAPAAAPAK